MKQVLGKITKATFGYFGSARIDGMSDRQIGLIIELGGAGWTTADERGAFRGQRQEDARWTERDRMDALGKACLFLDETLQKAKKRDIAELVGVPVMVQLEENNQLKGWRVLEEVL